MRTFYTAAVIAYAVLPPGASAEAEESYEPTCDSTDQYNATAEWFRDAKLGVYCHRGGFTTPNYTDEWYGQKM